MVMILTFFYSKRKTKNLLRVGGTNIPVVIGDLSRLQNICRSDLGQFGYLYSQIMINGTTSI